MGYYMKTDLWKHQKYFCVKKKFQSAIKRIIEIERWKGDCCSINQDLKNVSHMATDTITLAGKNGPHVVELGMTWVLKTYRMKQQPARQHVISQKTTELLQGRE